DLGVLNGTRLTVRYIDTYRGRLHCVDEQQQAARIPFRYAAAGNLTHAYAMTIHKAQGATIERALVLADETLTREQAYTALSRATRGTDIFVDTVDPAIEAHAPAAQPEPVDRLRASVSRSVSQQLAIDRSPHDLVPLQALRAERDRLQHQLRDRPPDRSGDLRRLQERIKSTRHSLEQAMWRQDQAQRRLEELGPVGRTIHRRERTELERRANDATLDVDRLTGELKTLTLRHGSASRLQREFTKWEHQHQPELDRLLEVDHTVWSRE